MQQVTPWLWYLVLLFQGTYIIIQAVVIEVFDYQINRS